MVTSSVNDRVNKHRTALRMAGLRPAQIWVPDTRRPDFAEECLKQSRLATEADAADHATHRLMHQAMSELEGWEP